MKWHSNYRVVSFYTPDYKQYAEKLISSLKRTNPKIPRTIVEIPQQKWAQATTFKADFILEQLEKKDQPILWIDADAEVLVNDLEFPEVEFAIYGRFSSGIRKIWSPFRTGTVYFGWSSVSRQLIKMWAEESVFQTNGSDQASLFRAWLRAMKDPNLMPSTYWLPLSYCQKFDEIRGKQQPKILHYMASRTLKRRK